MNTILVIRYVKDVVIIDIDGVITQGVGAQSLHAKLLALGQCRRPLAVVNLASVPSLDSAGVGELMAAYAAVALVGGDLKILSPIDSVLSTLHTTHLDQILDVYFDESSALGSFAGKEEPGERFAIPRETRSEWYFG